MYAIPQPKQDTFYNAAIRFSERENLEQIAIECALKPQMLRNKLNPNQPHQLTVRELVSITKQSGNSDLVNSVLLELDLTASEIAINGCLLVTKSCHKSPRSCHYSFHCCHL
ncbi:phage regulatory CII family protein [Photobacterium kishitanii]|uniref:phage regulatory CII family protein n=1 Tax=Photobacterium kishitanii TaxID=318456 RepID=UPI002738FC87|nr:phage regulatory CII family protein [Photobacterium kishitanii]